MEPKRRRWTKTLRVALDLLVVAALTVLTQIGGVAWIIACFFRRRLFAFVAAYAALSVAATWVAPSFGRVALSCLDEGALQVQSWMYCALNRNYVSPEMAEVLRRAAEGMSRTHPGTVTLVLDANFPFLDGFPLLPHLSHDDGDKADIAFHYRDDSGYLKGATRSPIGYFAFEQGPTDCPKVWPTLRWNFDFIQRLWHDHGLDAERTRDVLRLLADDESVGRILLEPHLVERLDVAHPKIRFQGCRAARHDDHVHLQLK